MTKLSVLAAIALVCASLLWTHDTFATNDEAEIRRLLDDWAKAFRARDLDGIMAIYSPDVVAFDIVPPLRYVGADAYRRDYAEFLAQYEGPLDVEVRDLRIVVGGNVAWSTSLERIGGNLKNGQRSDVWLRVTSGFEKVNGKWKDTHDHVSVPVDPGTGQGVVNLKP